MDSDPPFRKAYKTFFDHDGERDHADAAIVEECELPLIDLRGLELGDDGDQCKSEIARASKEWGFFQVVNHGISHELLEKMKSEQEKVFKKSFDIKSQEDKYFNFSAGTYRWGSPMATTLKQLSWSEAFHIPLNQVSAASAAGFGNLRIRISGFGLSCIDEARLPSQILLVCSTIEQFAATVSSLALKLAEILAEKLSRKSTFFHENCLPSTCYLRMNRYPPCPIPSEVFGLMPHTDSDFLTILHQDQVGGLQLVKDGRWIAVKPNPDALIINIGDLFQAWSNNVYKSVEHRVVTNMKVERFSTAYFFCPSYDTVIDCCCEPSVYRKFSFGEYRHRVQEDVKQLGSKVGLPRFLV